MAQPQTYGTMQDSDGPETLDLTREEGRQVADETRRQAGAVAGTAREQAGNVATEAMDHARDLAGTARQQLHHQARQQTDALGGAIGTLGGRVQALADGDVDGAGPVGDYAQRLAGQVEQFAGRVDELGFDGMVDEVQRYARRKPGAFLLGAAVAGFAISRLARGAQSAQSDASSGPGGATPSPAVRDGMDRPRELPANPAATTRPATATGMTGGASVAATPPPPPVPHPSDPVTGDPNDLGRTPR